MATINDPWPKRSYPDGHPADGMALQVDMGDGAWATIPDPRSYEKGGLAWTLTWGLTDDVRYVAAGVIESYDYLLSGNITQAEAIRRLRELRRVRRAALSPAGQGGRDE